jgi:hypothetical protein
MTMWRSRVNGNQGYYKEKAPSASTVLVDDSEQRQQCTNEESITDKWKRILPGMLKQNDGQTNISRPVCLNTENSKTNSSWGDELVGKDVHHTRVYVINVNGISID